MNLLQIMIYYKGNIININIGGPDRKCIQLYIQNRQLLVNEFVFNDACCLAGKGLEKSDGTIDMVRAAIVFIARKFPGLIDRFEYQDSSYFACPYLRDGKKVSTNIELAPHHLLLYGKTWYERIFGSKYVKPLIKHKTAIDIARKNRNIHIIGTYDDFSSKVRSTSVASMSWEDNNRELMKSLFDQSKTLKEFLNKVQSLDRSLQPCLYFDGRLQALYRFVGFDMKDITGTSWEIKDVYGCANKIIKDIKGNFSIHKVSIKDIMSSESFANYGNVYNEKDLDRHFNGIGTFNDIFPIGYEG